VRYPIPTISTTTTAIRKLTTSIAVIPSDTPSAIKHIRGVGIGMEIWLICYLFQKSEMGAWEREGVMDGELYDI